MFLTHRGKLHTETNYSSKITICMSDSLNITRKSYTSFNEKKVYKFVKPAGLQNLHSSHNCLLICIKRHNPAKSNLIPISIKGKQR